MGGLYCLKLFLQEAIVGQSGQSQVSALSSCRQKLLGKFVLACLCPESAFPYWMGACVPFFFFLPD